MPRPIRFLLGQELCEVSGEDPHLTVLEWLRTRERRTGTKEGCAEGDCGACTVAVGSLKDGRIHYRAVNSCIQLLATLDGRQLVTVEDLATGKPGEESLHPVQHALVEQHGSQCGFCTPGFVMSLFTLYHEIPRPDGSDPNEIGRSRIDQAIAGNLCRCTGYAPIVRAAQQALASGPDDSFTRERKRFLKQLEALQSAPELAFEHSGLRWFTPRTLASLWKLRAQFPEACLVAGATDVGLWLTKNLRRFDTLIFVGEVAELLRIEQSEAGLRVGAAVTYTDALPSLCDGFPAMRPMLLRLGADQVRNAGTIGGNIANGSPIGDMPPALVALGARLTVSSSRGRREMPLEDFFIEYGRQDLRPDECVESIMIPAAKAGGRFAVYKVSKRFDQDISALCGAFAVQIQDGRVRSARICFGGMAGTPKRAFGAEQALAGNPWSLETVEAAKVALAGDYAPITDWRASTAYRKLVAQNLLRRFYLESLGSGPVQLAGGAAA